MQVSKSVRSNVLFAAAAVAFILLSAPIVRAAGPTATAPVSKVDEAVQAVEAQTHQSDSDVDSADRQNSGNYLAQVKTALGRGDLANARDIAQNATRSVRNADYQVVWSQLLAQLNKASDEAQKAFPDMVKAALDNARTKCLAAKSEDELEGLDEDLTNLSNQAQRNVSGERYSERRQSAAYRLQNAAQAVRQWRDMLAAQATGNIMQALNYLSSIEQNQSRLFAPTVLAKVRETIISSVNDAMDKQIAALAELVAQSTKPEECQKALDKFSRDNRNVSNYNGGYGEMNRAPKAIQTVQTWINVWTAQLAGRPRQALQIIAQAPIYNNNFNNGVNTGGAFDYAVISQKTWTAKQAELSKMVAQEGTAILEPELKRMVDEINKAETLDAMIEVARKTTIDPSRGFNQFNQFNQPSQFDNQTVVNEIAAWTNDVNTLAALRDDLANSKFRNIIASWTGASANVVVNPYGVVTTFRPPVHRWKTRTQAIKIDIFCQALSRFSQIPDLKPATNESSDQMLLRVADEAFNVHDYHKMLLALDAYRTAFYPVGPTPDWLASDLKGCGAYLAGTNYEAAEVPIAAAKCYMEVLGETGSHVPVKEAGEHLKAMRQKFPDAVSAAATQPMISATTNSTPVVTPGAPRDVLPGPATRPE